MHHLSTLRSLITQQVFSRVLLHIMKNTAKWVQLHLCLVLPTIWANLLPPLIMIIWYLLFDWCFCLYFLTTCYQIYITFSIPFFLWFMASFAILTLPCMVGFPGSFTCCLRPMSSLIHYVRLWILSVDNSNLLDC